MEAVSRLDPRVRALVRDNKNTRLHILFVLWGLPGPTSAAEVAAEINCSADTVEDLLPRMEADGYVGRIGPGRHPRWCLTDKAAQLPLPGLVIFEGEKLTLNSSSSSSGSLYIEREENKQLLLQQTQAEGKKTPLTPPPTPEHAFPTEWLPVFKALRETGASNAIAERATIAVSKSEEYFFQWPITVELAIAEWVCYAVGDHGKTLKAPGIFIATQIEQSQRVPHWFKLDEQTGWAAKRARDIRQRIEQEDNDAAAHLPKEEPDDDGIAASWEAAIKHQRARPYSNAAEPNKWEADIKRKDETLAYRARQAKGARP